MICRTAFRAWLVLCVVLFAMAQLPGVANTYYVSTTGSDSNDGTGPDDTHAWATIDKGDRDKVLNPGDEVVILAGTYDVSAGAGIGLRLRVPWIGWLGLDVARPLTDSPVREAFHGNASIGMTF